MKAVALLALGLVLGAVATAHAQEPGHVGLTIAHPAAVGFIWHATDRVAIRPDLSVSRTRSETRGSPGPFVTSSTARGSSIGVGVSALVYLQPRGPRFRTYVAPRVGYSRGQSTSVSPSGFEARSTTTGRAWGLSYGAQYLATDRFGVFGEAGLGGSFTRLTSTATQLRTTGHSWGTRGGVGVTVYF
jgi:hypothetical protein